MYQLKMLEDPWKELTDKNHQYSHNQNSIKHCAFVEDGPGDRYGRDTGDYEVRKKKYVAKE